MTTFQMAFKRDPNNPDKEKHCTGCDLFFPAEKVFQGKCSNCALGLPTGEGLGIGGESKRNNAARKRARHEANKARRAEDNRKRKR